MIFDKVACGTIWFIKKSGLRRIFLMKNLFVSHSILHLISSFLFCWQIHRWIRWFKSKSYLNTQWVQRRNLCQTVMKKWSGDIPVSNQHPWDTHRTAPIQFHNSSYETMCVSTRIINITITRLVSIRVSEALLFIISESLGLTVTMDSKQLWHNRYSHSKVCMCGVSTEQWPSAQITLFERKCNSA